MTILVPGSVEEFLAHAGPRFPMPSPPSTRCMIVSGASLVISAAPPGQCQCARYWGVQCDSRSAFLRASIAREVSSVPNQRRQLMLQLSRPDRVSDVGNWKKLLGATTRRSHCMASCKPRADGIATAPDHWHREASACAA